MSHLKPDLEKGGWSWDQLVVKEVEATIDCAKDIRKLEHLMSKLEGDEDDKIAVKNLVREVWGSFSLKASIAKCSVDKAYMDLNGAEAVGEVWKGKYKALKEEHAALVKTATLPPKTTALKAAHRNELKDCQAQRDQALNALNAIKKTHYDELKDLQAKKQKDIGDLESKKQQEIDELEGKFSLADSRLSENLRTIAGLNHRIANLKSQKTVLKDQKITMESEKTTLESENATLQRDKTFLWDENTTLREENAAVKKKKDTAAINFARYKDTRDHSIFILTDRVATLKNWVVSLKDQVATQSAEAAEALKREERYKHKINVLERNPIVTECLNKLVSLEHGRAACENVFMHGNTAEEREDAELQMQVFDSEINGLKKTVFESREIDYKGKYDLVARESAEFAKRELKYVNFTSKTTKKIDGLTAELADARKQLRAYQGQGSAVPKDGEAHRGTTEIATESQRTNTATLTGDTTLGTLALNGTLSTSKTPDQKLWMINAVKGFLQQIAANEIDVQVPLAPAVTDPDPDPFYAVRLNTAREQTITQGHLVKEKPTTDSRRSVTWGKSIFEKTSYGSTKRSASPNNRGGGKRPKGSKEPDDLTPERKQVLAEMNICVLHHLDMCTMKRCARFHMDRRVVDPLVDMLLEA
ncbi:hypothetical protein P171DRAFT_478954 [Karstenula rhodostoma CBS 690.94]|uniref:Uncharacterized protein n=1 Tax=Karstenula rhodostoma CBS 690.94 TaxID=1392251 RepID=A0A9P4PX85_9PLEO|nr:hypothetical protein P171DRAFT_478954 [Karstenula rhodostoma CBS 690.94]